MRRAARIAGTLMIVAGIGSIGWVLLVWQWQDPFTAIYTKYEQHRLASSFAHRFAVYRPPARTRRTTSARPGAPRPLAAERAQIKADAGASGLPPALLRDAPVHRVRKAHAGDTARRQALLAGRNRPNRLTLR